jgi:oxygen-independent coproporphyrinogen III oxidase
MDTGLPDAGRDLPTGAAGVYVHIPFCRAKCAYCDFPSFAGLEPLYGSYVGALLWEIERAPSGWLALGFDTLFVGGGTPTTMPAADLVLLLQACRRHLGVPLTAEVSIEANPGTVSAVDLSMLRGAGYNRLSLGMQSLRDDELALLGRIHTAEESLQAYRWARDAGFTNLNLDLIYGLPRQTVAQWRESLERALNLGPEHLSLYALSVEAGTPLEARIARGALPAPDDAAAADMYELSEELLDRAGYAHYEISNWARRGPGDRSPDLPAWACRHNLKYWRNQPYLGLGSAAHSYDGRCRRASVTSPQEYIARVEAGRDVVAEEECPDRNQRMDETMMLGLRLVEGVSHEAFARRFGVGLADVYGTEIAELVEDGLLQVDERGIRLTPRGRLLGNRVFAAFLRG